MRCAVLGSGSDANAYLFEHGSDAYLFDNGFSLRETERRAEDVGFDLRKVRFIFLTHIHSDHLKGVSSFSRKYKVPVVAHHRLCLEDHLKQDPFQKLDIWEHRDYDHGALRFRAFPTSHDAPFSLAYHFSLGGTRVSIISDTGVTDDTMLSCAENSHLLFLEANYDKEMLKNGSYPYYLKRRIASERGHLSNDDAIAFLNSLSHGCCLDHVYFCHLSGNNNCPDILKKSLDKDLSWNGRYTILEKGHMYKVTEELTCS